MTMPTLNDFAEVVRAVLRERAAYLRYSEGPEADVGAYSRDYEAGVDMPGLSATLVTPEPWWPRPQEDWIARRLCKYAELGDEEGRYPWLLRGEVAGYGPDHEPLLVEITPIAVVGRGALDRARALYRERFDVAQDSR